MKILITGHKGFIGQNLVKEFDEHDLEFYEWSDSRPSIRGLDWVIHVGAISSTTETNVEKILTQNLDFSKWLLDECIVHGVNFQYASSASVYGLTTNFREDAPKNPLNAYAWSKFLFDRHVESFKNAGIAIQGFRYFNVYGPYEDHKGNQASPYYKFEKEARDTGVINLFKGSDKFLRDFVHVADVCKIHRMFLSPDVSGIFNVGSGRATSFESVARMIADRYEAKVKYIPMPDNLKSQYQTYTCADLTKLQKTINEKNLR